MSARGEVVFLSGATGFIGQHLYPRLIEEGFSVRCGTRSVERAQRRFPDRLWVPFDVEDSQLVRAALQGCDSAFYLVHQMGSGAGYHDRERKSAYRFRQAAADHGLRRIVYLGGVEPGGAISDHLSSRLETGCILRNGEVSAIELRASMIIGAGSASWRIVRDLAARLPLMLLPKWTQSRTEPVYIDDVVEALVGALRLQTSKSHRFDIPGPDRLTVEEILRTTARVMGHDTVGLRVPLLSPELSSRWLRFVTRGDLFLARELVKGLKGDLLAEDDSYWELIGHHDRVGFEDAVRRTLDGAEPESVAARGVERLASWVGRSVGSP